MATHHDIIEEFFTYGIHQPSSTLFWDGGESGTIDDAFVATAVKGLHILQHAPNITVLLNVRGGDVFCAKAVYDAVRSMPCPVRMVAYGSVMSAGAILLQAADVRSLMPNTLMMIHYGYESLEGETAISAYRWMQRSKEAGKWMEDVLLERIQQKRPSIKRAYVKRALEHDTYYSATEAVDMGLADEVENESI
jgi:ATP-dependent Clp protease protease subunit